MYLAGSREAGETAIGPGDHILPPDDLGEPSAALGDRLGMLDKIRAMGNDAGDHNFPVRQFDLLPDAPLVLVPRVASLERVGAGVHPHHDVDNLFQLEIVHSRTHVDAVARVITYPLLRD